MRIGIPMNVVYHPDGQMKQIDGIGRYTDNLQRALTATQQVKVDYIFFHGLRVKPNANNFPPATHFALKPTLGNYLPWDNYGHLEESIDLIHTTDYLSPVTKRIPIVTTLHDAIALKHPQWTEPKPWRFRLKKAILRRCARQANHIITISHAMVNDIAQYFRVPEEKISVVYSGIDAHWFYPIELRIKQQILQAYQLENTNFLLTVGTLQPRKNIETIVAALQQLSQRLHQKVKLIIVGQVLPGLTPPSLLSKIKHYEAKGLIKWLNYVDFPTLQCLYQQADLFLFPSLEEGFGLPILESFASQTPVITSYFGATAEVAGSAGYLIDPYSTEQLTNAMETLLRKPELYQSHIERGYQRAGQFTWAQCAEQTKRVYHHTLENFSK